MSKRVLFVSVVTYRNLRVAHASEQVELLLPAPHHKRKEKTKRRTCKYPPIPFLLAAALILTSSLGLTSILNFQTPNPNLPNFQTPNLRKSSNAYQPASTPKMAQSTGATIRASTWLRGESLSFPLFLRIVD